MPESKLQNFLFTDIGEEKNFAKYMDGMAAGTFISMYGDEITFLPEDLPEYIKNTQRVLNSTKTENGEIVGLPIDQDAHDYGGGAGWIIGLELDEARNVIRFLVNWTEIGLELISKNIRRFFSPSIDIENKVILGGSLTNYPATRNTKGQILLRPIELSQSNSLKEFDMPKTMQEMFDEFATNVKTLINGGSGATPPAPPAPAAPVAAPVTQPTDLSTDAISPNLRAFLADPEGAEHLGKLAEERAQELIKDEKRKHHVVDFVKTLVGGTREKPFGLKVPAKRVVALLLSLPEAQAREVEFMLSTALTTAIDFSQHGFDDDGIPNRPPLPPFIASLARDWMKTEGNTIQEFFKINPEIGKIEDFNVSEFVKAKE